MALSRRPGGCGSFGRPVANRMKRISYSGYRFPPAIIQQAIWLYLRFTLSLRDVEDLLAERGIAVSSADRPESATSSANTVESQSDATERSSPAGGSSRRSVPPER